MSVLQIIFLVIVSVILLACLPYIIFVAIDVAEVIGKAVVYGWKELIWRIFRK